MRELLKSAGRLLIGGHRGCMCEYPENSIMAMEEGMRRGCDYLEIDIQLTKDGIPVVFHDTSLEEKTPLSGYVHDVTYAQLKTHVPALNTMQEVLEWGKLRKAWFALELKTVPLDMQQYNFMLVEKMAALLRETGMIDRVFVFGLDYQVLQHLHKVDSTVAIGLIVPFVPADPVQLMRDMHATVYLSYIFNMTPDIIQKLHENGYYVSGAILREECWIDRARSLGVDMFESDEPENFSIIR